MPVAKIAISLPENILDEIDRQAETWYANRSHAIVRIFQEWKAAHQPHLFIVPDEPNNFPTNSFTNSFPTEVA
jgi:Arc/MetJ-type ribon-helix-helix transcriptional regulator